MFGTFRFLLAATVLIGHIYADMPFHMGVAAVANFFIISGFVMTCLIRKSYDSLGKPTIYFYVDRFFRIFPQYFLYLVVTQICLLCFPFAFFSAFFKGESSVTLFLANALIVPVNYFFYLPTLSFCLLIPSAWSLGLEEQFYWLFPALVLRPWAGRIATVLSVATFLTAFCQFINPEIWGFRLLPGVLFMFMMGKHLADYRTLKSQESFWTLIVLYMSCLTLLVLTLLEPEPLKNQNIHELIGIVAGFPIVVFLSQLPRKKWDEILGSCSYGIFLNHILILNLLVHFKLFVNNRFEATVASLVFSTLSGFATFFLVERNINRYRMKIRERQRAKTLIKKQLSTEAA